MTQATMMTPEPFSHNEYVKHRKRVLLAAGTCPCCGKVPVATGKRKCPRCLDRAAAKCRVYRADPLHKSRRREYMRAYTKSDASRQYHRERKRREYSVNVEFRLVATQRSRLWHALKGTAKSARTLELLGCSVATLKAHLEAQFTRGMTWETYGNGAGRWNIDHVVPFAGSDLADEEQLRAVCHYTNLRPMWSTENFSKGAKRRSTDAHDAEDQP